MTRKHIALLIIAEGIIIVLAVCLIVWRSTAPRFKFVEYLVHPTNPTMGKFVVAPDSVKGPPMIVASNKKYNPLLRDVNVKILYMYNFYWRFYGTNRSMSYDVLENKKGIVRIAITGSGQSESGEKITINDIVIIDARALRSGGEATMAVLSEFPWASQPFESWEVDEW